MRDMICPRCNSGNIIKKRKHRLREGAEGLRNSLPPEYRQCAVIYTYFREAYAGVLPSERHRPAAENSGKTGYIGRFNNTVRQRISRFVRKTLSFSFSKKLRIT